MDKKIAELKKRYVNAKSDKERDAINKEMSELSAKDGDAFTRAMMSSIDDTSRRVEDLALRVKLKEALPIVSLSYIAKTYFGKTTAWFYQRLNGNVVNGKPVHFTKEETETLRFALSDISKKIGSVSTSL